jgi:hypothetical protein
LVVKESYATKASLLYIEYAAAVHFLNDGRILDNQRQTHFEPVNVIFDISRTLLTPLGVQPLFLVIPPNSLKYGMFGFASTQ